MLHACVLLSAPAQSAPPKAGAGLEQDRVCVWSPPPHVTLHVDHEDHDDHDPSTERSAISIEQKILG